MISYSIPRFIDKTAASTFCCLNISLKSLFSAQTSE